ncbi:MAG: hypothetical protein ACR2JF_06700 [Iamia sp.]
MVGAEEASLVSLVEDSPAAAGATSQTGPSVFTTTEGRTMLAYAGWDVDQVGPPNPRRLHLAELNLTPDDLTTG